MEIDDESRSALKKMSGLSGKEDSGRRRTFLGNNDHVYPPFDFGCGPVGEVILKKASACHRHDIHRRRELGVEPLDDNFIALIRWICRQVALDDFEYRGYEKGTWIVDTRMASP